MNIVIPLAGKDPRFAEMPKPFCDVGGRPLIALIVERLQLSANERLIFIILREHDEQFQAGKRLRDLFGDTITVRVIPQLTQGSPQSILEGAKDLLENDEDVLIELGDVVRDTAQLRRDIQEHRQDVAGIIPVMKTVMHGKLWGYVLLDEKGNVTALREKEEQASSDLATMGLYYFSKGKDFVWAAEQMIANRSFLWHDLFFIGPMYNELVKRGDRVIVSMNRIDDVLGSPDDLQRYRRAHE